MVHGHRPPVAAARRPLRGEANFLDPDPSRHVARDSFGCDHDGPDGLRGCVGADAGLHEQSEFGPPWRTQVGNSVGLGRKPDTGRRHAGKRHSRCVAGTRPTRTSSEPKIGRAPGRMRDINLHRQVVWLVLGPSGFGADLSSLVRTSIASLESRGQEISRGASTRTEVQIPAVSGDQRHCGRSSIIRRLSTKAHSQSCM